LVDKVKASLAERLKQKLVEEGGEELLNKIFQKQQ